MNGIRRILDVEKTLKKLVENKDYFTDTNMKVMILECRRELLEGSRELLSFIEGQNKQTQNLINKVEGLL